jgi:hypothetical protein
MSVLGSAKYNLPLVQANTPDASALHVGNVSPSGDASSTLSPSEPLLWLLGLGAVLFGLVSVSTSARIGPLKAAVAL